MAYRFDMLFFSCFYFLPYLFIVQYEFANIQAIFHNIFCLSVFHLLPLLQEDFLNYHL